MGGRGSNKRQHVTARLAYSMSKDGKTHRQIAEAINRPVENIRKWIDLGERLVSMDSQKLKAVSTPHED